MSRAALTAKAVEEKLREHRGNMAAVGRALGVTRSAVFNFIRRRTGLQAVVGECRESMKDDTESALYTAALAGEAWAVCFYLKTQARDRGYIERVTVDVDAVNAKISRLFAGLGILADRRETDFVETPGSDGGGHDGNSGTNGDGLNGSGADGPL